MTDAKHKDAGHRPATRSEIVEIAGALDDLQIAQIEGIGATPAEVLEAFARIDQEDDFSAETFKPLAGRVARVYDILTADRPEEDEI